MTKKGKKFLKNKNFKEREINKKEKQILRALKEFIELKKNFKKKRNEKEKKEFKKEEGIEEKIFEESSDFSIGFESVSFRSSEEIVPILKKMENKIESVRDIEQLLKKVSIKKDKEGSSEIYSEKHYLTEHYKEDFYSEKNEMPERKILEESNHLFIKTQIRNQIEIKQDSILAKRGEKFDESIKYELKTPNGEKRTLFEKPERKYEIRKDNRRI